MKPRAPKRIPARFRAIALGLWLGAAAPVRAAPAQPVPDTATTPAQLDPAVEAIIVEKEGEIRKSRKEGIALLEAFLKDSADSPETAEALFKLAELTWEEAQADYLARMDKHQALIAACKADRARCRDLPPRPPRLDLSRSQSTYQRLVRDYPRFRKLDTVLYLYAFSLREEGRAAEAVAAFERLLLQYPKSRFRADAWMAVAEYRFYEKRDYASAQSAYERVLKYPDSPLSGLALFQTAFCAWKRGNAAEAATRWKMVLDLAGKAKSGTADQQKRAAELSDQALDYLVELFTEDDSKTAEDAYAFLAQIGGKAYSQKVMHRFADTVYDQARYERSADAYLFLIALDPKSPEAPALQRRVVESFQALGKGDRAVAEMRKLAIEYGPKSAWAKANADRPQLQAEARASAEGFIRAQAKSQHARAQRNEKESHHVDRALYAQAAETYAFYLDQFPQAKDAMELRYLRADILYFKLNELRAAGHEYLAVGRSQPVGPAHKEALLGAMNAFEKLRPPAPAPNAGGDRKREVTDDDRRFAEAADLYAALFPKDKEIVTVIYKNGQFFYDHGDYDEAVKRFGLILEQHPDSDVASAAGDRLLECLAAAKDYANIEQWSRRLKKARAFSSRRDQDRLDGLIAGAMAKQGEALVANEDHAGAALMFRKLALQFPNQPRAAEAWNNAGASAEKAGQLGESVAAYKTLADKFPKSPLAPAGLWTAGRIEESIGAYARAAALYEQMAHKYPQAPDAPAALRQAGLLRQTLGQGDKAAVLYTEYEKQYRGRPETQKVAFQKGLVLVERKDWKGAAAAFGEYARSYDKDPTAVEALVRKADAHLHMGDEGATREALSRALSLARGRHKGEETAGFAAEARFRQGELASREFEKVKLTGKPRQLRRALEEKAKLLEEARKIYLDVVSFRDPEWATLALLRIGQAYEGYGKAMRKAEVPRDLSAEEKRIYREELEKAVIVIEDKALEAYRSGYAKALEIGVYNKHTRALRQALSDLDRGTFPKEAEARPGLRVAELKTALAPILEIQR
jgi:TolA-binding protein